MAEAKVILVTGASSGFGALTARTLADAKHVVYAGMRGITGRNEQAAAAARAYADDNGVTLRPVEMDVSDQASVDHAVTSVLAEEGRIDVLIHNAGHMVLGPTEAFTPEQIADVYDTNVLSTQRVNRAALPHMRERGDGLLVWVGSSSSRGGTPPYLGRSVLRREGRRGRARGQLRRGAHQVRDRDDDRHSWFVHVGHQPLRPRGPRGG